VISHLWIYFQSFRNFVYNAASSTSEPVPELGGIPMSLLKCRCLLFFLLVFLLIAATAQAQNPCLKLAALKIPNLTITSVTAQPAGWELPVQEGFIKTSAGTKVSVPFCRIEAYSAPTSDSHIGMEIWLPIPDNWNGKFFAVGNPGFIGSLARGALVGNVQQGYATATTDTGHVDETAGWAPHHPEKWTDWGYRAVHEMTVAAKQFIQNYYGKRPKYSYWNSCHNGGNQGLNEAQRYPEDFDGIVAADPAFYISHLQAGSLYISWVALKDGVDGPGYIAKKLSLINKAALNACDEVDGLKDGLISDPRQCKFDPKSIQCPNDKDAPSCLTAAQVDTVKKIYAGAKFNDGTRIYSGLEPGSELNWAPIMVEKEPFFVNVDYFKGMVKEDLNWDWRTFDVDKDTREAIAKTGKAVDGNNPDLKPFKKAGGKLIIVGSWNSTALPTRTLTEYYDQVEKAMGGLSQTQDFARLFMVPGSSGCPGFMGGQRDFDSFSAIQNWIEKGIAPESIVFNQGGQDDRSKQTQSRRSRLVCTYPNVAKYKGMGSIYDAANFTCVAPAK
jgi:feruloyl esterase